MGLAWQQGPPAPGAIGRFLLPDPLPERLLYAEPLRRRMRVRFDGAGIADSEDLVLLHEPGSDRDLTTDEVAPAGDHDRHPSGRLLMAYPSVSAVRADAVFASARQRCDEPSTGQVRQAVSAAIRAFGCSGCAGRMAQEFGDHREAAVIRMRWARIVDPAPETGPGADTAWWPAIRPRMIAEHTSSSAGGAVT
jgi:hypothetical protein